MESDSNMARPRIWKLLAFLLALPMATALFYALFADLHRLYGYPFVQQFCFGALVAIGVGATVAPWRENAPRVYRSQKRVGLVFTLGLTVVLAVLAASGEFGPGGGFLLAPVWFLGPYLYLRDRWPALP